MSLSSSSLRRLSASLESTPLMWRVESGDVEEEEGVGRCLELEGVVVGLFFYTTKERERGYKKIKKEKVREWGVY